MCSGLIIRGVELQQGMKLAWSLTPQNKEKISISYAYLRRDQKFGQMGGIDSYDAGFILYPQLKTPPHKSVTIPIQAFFYIAGIANGSTNAMKYCNDFYRQSGVENIPIVAIKLPSSGDEDIQINFKLKWKKCEINFRQSFRFQRKICRRKFDYQ